LQKCTEDYALINYLLGELSETERDRIEDGYFADDGLHERLLALEDELTDCYVRGELSPKQRQHFEEWFLRSPERKERLKFTRAYRAQKRGSNLKRVDLDETLYLDNPFGCLGSRQSRSSS